MTVQNFLLPKLEDRRRRDPKKENTDDLWQKDLMKSKKKKHEKDLKQSKK